MLTCECFVPATGRQLTYACMPKTVLIMMRLMMLAGGVGDGGGDDDWNGRHA